MKVNLTFVTSVNNSLPAFEIPGHGVEKINITFSGDNSTKVILNAGHGDCKLQIGTTDNTTNADSPTMVNEVKDDAKPKDTVPPTYQTNLLTQLSFYSKQVTPVYGAYIAFLAALIVGASWALCSFRKRRSDGGVPYQELEMGLPESSRAVDGWDQDWDDDDWDEDKAIRSPGGRVQSKGVSSNGLASRPTQKDGWDADWDD